MYDLNEAKIESAPPKDLVVLNGGNGGRLHFNKSKFTATAEQRLRQFNKLYEEHQMQIVGREIPRRFMHRVFNHDFEHGGRFYGPEWQWRKKTLRPSIKIDGQPIVELDYSSFHPTILYAQVGEQFRDDLYRVRGYPFDGEFDRQFLKTVLLTRINCKNNVTAARRIQQDINFGKLHKPAWLGDVRKLVDAVTDRNTPIKHLFTERTGARLQRVDSEITEAILLHFLSLGTPALPIHDSYIVQSKFMDELHQIMESVFSKYFGMLCKIDQKWKK